MAKEKLTASAEARYMNIQYSIGALSLLGGVGGVIYSAKTGGGFWRGVGYYFLGSIAVGVIGKVVALPFENKIIKDGVVKVDDSQTQEITQSFLTSEFQRLNNKSPKLLDTVNVQGVLYRYVQQANCITTPCDPIWMKDETGFFDGIFF